MSRSVSWWDVHTYIAAALAKVGSWPMVGTPAWCALADDNPAKIASIFDAAQHWALRVETAQIAQCEASAAISCAEDWGWFALTNRNLEEFRAANPWARRAVS